MSDPRYVKIHGKPVLVIYRINIFERDQFQRLLRNFREIAKNNGFPDLYIMVTNAFDFRDNPSEWGADALVEFPPHIVQNLMEKYRPEGYLNPYYNGRILYASSFIKHQKYMLKHNGQSYFRTALLSWDNAARKSISKGFIMQGLTSGTFRKWMKDIVIESKQIHTKEENIVFVNAWNEWAEGAHLEP